DDQKPPRLDVVLVLDHGVLGDSHPDQRGEESARRAADGCPLEPTDDGADERTENDDVAHDRNDEEGRRQEDADEASPEGAGLSPESHAIAGVVVADRVLLRLEVLSDDRELLHVEAALLKRFDRKVGLRVRGVDGDSCTRVVHWTLLFSMGFWICASWQALARGIASLGCPRCRAIERR